MAHIPAVLLVLVVVLGILILGAVFAEPITALVQRRFPTFSYQGEKYLLWGVLVGVAFVFGLLVMYLLLRP